MIVARIIFMRILRSKRTWALGALPALGVFIGIVALGAADPSMRYGHYVRNLLVPIVVALVALVISTSAIVDERDDLTILYLTQTPLARGRIVAEVWLSAVAATVLLVGGPVIVALLLAGRAGLATGAAAALVIAVGLAVAGYCALGVLLGLLTRRAALIGLVYVLVWEGTLSGFAAGARNLSIAQHARAIIARGLEPEVRVAVDPPSTGPAVAVVAMVATTIVALALAGRRLRRMNLP